MKIYLLVLIFFFGLSLSCFSQVLEVRTMPEALNYAGDRNVVKKLIITDSIKGTDYSEGSEWREFRTLDSAFPNIEAVEILTNQDIPNYHQININDSIYYRGLFCLYHTDGVYNGDGSIFYPSNWLKYFSAPNTKRIGAVAFFKCENLISINFPIAEIIELGTFSHCENLTAIDFPNVKIIAGNGNFFSCSSLKSINFPVIESIGWMAFGDCLNLKFVNLGTNFMNTATVEFGSAVFGDSLDEVAIIYNCNKVITDKIELTLGKNVLPSPNLLMNTWQGTRGYNDYAYTWKSIEINSGIEDEKAAKTSDIFSINNNIYYADNILKLELYDLAGRKVRDFNNQEIIDLNNFPAGVYFFRYVKNFESKTEKVVVVN